MGIGRADIISDPHRPLTRAQSRRLERFLIRRERREPVSHIVGRQGFWNVSLKVSANVLTPRPETETVVQAALARFEPQRRFTVLDLGVGSGAILLAILAERSLATGVGVDISKLALEVARENAADLGLAKRATFVQGNWAAGLASAAFDLVVCNPPYIPSDDIAALEPEVRDHEPRIALDGGADGLAAYVALAKQILRVLRPGGAFILEIGPDQLTAVRDLFARAGACGMGASRDLAGRERAVFGQKKSLGETWPNG